MIKKLLCMIASVVVVMSCCTMAKGETVDERVNRVYPDWKEDWEMWNNKSIVEEYDGDIKYLVCAVIEHESRYCNVGSVYRGVMQISTSKDVLNFLGVSKDDLWDEKTNVRCGVKMLNYYLDKSEGNIERALCMYACGEGNSKKRKTYCNPSKEIYVLYKKYKQYFEEQDWKNFLLSELEDRKEELETLIECTENADSKKREYYSIRIRNVGEEISEIEKMLG